MKISVFTLIVALLHLPLVALAEPDPGEGKIVLAKQMLELWPVERKPIAVMRITGTQVLEHAGRAIYGRLPADKHEAVMVEVGSDVNAYLDEVTPIVSQNASRVKSSMLLPFLLENFSAAEMEELVSMLDSPVTQKFKRLAPEIQQRYEGQVAEESADTVKSHLDQLTGKVNEKLTTAVRSQ